MLLGPPEALGVSEAGPDALNWEAARQRRSRRPRVSGRRGRDSARVAGEGKPNHLGISMKSSTVTRGRAYGWLTFS